MMLPGRVFHCPPPIPVTHAVGGFLLYELWEAPSSAGRGG